jgi:hypothetical protein
MGPGRSRGEEGKKKRKCKGDFETSYRVSKKTNVSHEGVQVQIRMISGLRGSDGPRSFLGFQARHFSILSHSLFVDLLSISALYYY